MFMSNSIYSVYCLKILFILSLSLFLVYREDSREKRNLYLGLVYLIYYPYDDLVFIILYIQYFKIFIIDIQCLVYFKKEWGLKIIFHV